MLTKACCVAVVILSLQSPAFALNPLRILHEGLGYLSSISDQVQKESPYDDEAPGAIIEAQTAAEELSISDSNTIMSEANQEAPENSSGKNDANDGILGSLFELGMSDIEKNEMHNQERPPIKEFLNEIGDLPILPLTNINDALVHSESHAHQGSPFLQFLDQVRGDAWGQFKSLALSYSNWLEEEYDIQDISGKLPISLVKKILDLGDKVNFLHVVGKKVDAGLAQHLANEIQPLFDKFESLNPGRAFGNSFSSVINNIIRDTAWKTMHQFVGHVIGVAERFVSRKDIDDFHAELAKSSPMVAKGLDFILNGPPRESAEGRSLSNRKGYHDYDHYTHKDQYGHEDVGYGGYGLYDESYGVYSQGYNSAAFLDPYLILGGLGAAALLAFLAYKVIVTTAGARRKRSDDLTFMELSDMPNIVYSFYNMLEGADEKYNSNDPIHLDDTSDLIAALNSLWHERESEVGCIRCSLFNFTKDHYSLGHNVADTLLIAGIAHVLGAEGSGQLVDEVGSAIAEGHQARECLRENNTCFIR